MYNHDHRESSSERLFSLSYFLLFRAMSVRAGKQYISWQKCLSSESRAESDEPWYGAMTDRNAERRCPATSMSRRAGRGGPLDEGRRRRHTGWSRLCHLAGIVKHCGRGHRESLWPYDYVTRSSSCFLANGRLILEDEHRRAHPT